MDNRSSYARTRERLEEIVTQVKAKDLPLEKSLDLYEEALRLGSSCAEMIDRTDFSAEEIRAAEVSGIEDGHEASVEMAVEADGDGVGDEGDDGGDGDGGDGEDDEAFAAEFEDELEGGEDGNEAVDTEGGNSEGLA
jgi:exodeoxyribonuclease VII small subunit